jgi:hypothetical protein
MKKEALKTNSLEEMLNKHIVVQEHANVKIAIPLDI